MHANSHMFTYSLFTTPCQFKMYLYYAFNDSMVAYLEF